jgi:hypothetical protein
MNLPGSPDTLKYLHTPAVSSRGKPKSLQNSESDFTQAEGVPFFSTNLIGVGHSRILWRPNGGKLAIAPTKFAIGSTLHIIQCVAH